MLPNDQAKKRDIVLGKSLEKNHKDGIDKLLAIKQPKKDIILDVFLKAKNIALEKKRALSPPTEKEEAE